MIAHLHIYTATEKETQMIITYTKAEAMSRLLAMAHIELGDYLEKGEKLDVIITDDAPKPVGKLDKKTIMTDRNEYLLINTETEEEFTLRLRDIKAFAKAQGVQAGGLYRLVRGQTEYAYGFILKPVDPSSFETIALEVYNNGVESNS